MDIIQKYLNINMDKKGLRGFIRNRLPKTWEIVLTRERKLTAFIEYVYEATPSVMKGGRGWRRGVHNITVGYNRCKIYEMFQAEKSKEGLIYWVGIYNKIKDLVRWTELGERERLQEVMQQCSGEMEFRKKVASEFNISPMDAAVVVKRFKNEFIKILKTKGLC